MLCPKSQSQKMTLNDRLWPDIMSLETTKRSEGYPWRHSSQAKGLFVPNGLMGN